MRAPGSPKPGTGRARYVSPRKRAGGFAAASSRQATRRGQARQATDLGGQRDEGVGGAGRGRGVGRVTGTLAEAGRRIREAYRSSYCHHQ